MEIKVAFYKKQTSLYTKGIYYVQKLQRTERPDFVHVELVVDGVWHTSSSIDGGVRERRISGDSGNWEFITLNVSVDEVALLKLFFYSQRNCGYDYLGVFLTQLLPLDIQSRERWFCSEIVAEALMLIGVLPIVASPSYYSPARLNDTLTILHNITNKPSFKVEL